MPKQPVKAKQTPDDTAEATDGMATSERAAEIASMGEVGLREFIELTGIGGGDYGIYKITRAGVTLRDTSLDSLPPSEQVKVLEAEEQFSLNFPCSPVQFQEWYDSTRGTNGVSDFPIAPAFLHALVGNNQAARATLGPQEPSSKIVAAFKVRPTRQENSDWWDARLRAAKRYGLKDARAQLGRAKQESQWYPTLVGAWLIENHHLTRSAVLQALENHFPEADTSYLP